MTLEEAQAALDTAWDGGYFDDLCVPKLTARGHARKLPAYQGDILTRARRLLGGAHLARGTVLDCTWVGRGAASRRAHAGAPDLRWKYHCPVRVAILNVPRPKETP